MVVARLLWAIVPRSRLRQRRRTLPAVIVGHPHQSTDDLWKIFPPRTNHRQDGRHAKEARRSSQDVVNYLHEFKVGTPQVRYTTVLKRTPGVKSTDDDVIKSLSMWSFRLDQLSSSSSQSAVASLLFATLIDRGCRYVGLA